MAHNVLLQSAMLDEGPLFGRRGHSWEVWPLLLFVLHVAQVLGFSRLYPEHRFDPDILSYFVYFRSWVENDSTLHGAAFFNQPKPLLVFGLGPLGNVTWAFYCSTVAAGVLGSVVYLIGRDALGRASALLWSLLLLVDPQIGFLALKSSADLYLAVFLFLTILFLMSGRLAAAAVALLLSALVKPVTLPCALLFLTVPGSARRRGLCMAIPFLAIPLTLLANHALLGSALDPGRFLGEFAVLRDTEGITPGEVVHFVFWTQLVKTRFVSTAPLGILGLFIWVVRDRRRLTSPLLLAPLLFLGGYLALAVATPYMPFFRFFWPLEVWFLGFITFGIVEVARRLAAGRRPIQAVAAAMLLLFALDDSLVRHLSYREHYALPMEANQSFVSSSRLVLQHYRLAGEHVLVPLAFQPYLLWELDTGSSSDIGTAEQLALHGTDERPAWILHVPGGYVSQRARDLVDNLIHDGGYEVRLSDGQASLFALPTAGSPAPLAANAG